MRRSGKIIQQAITQAVLASGICAPAVLAQIPAFPGADGAAANVTGGRGGLVYHVTVLDASYQDTSSGTLRYGLNNANFPAGPRTIVFDVGGRINLGRVVAGWDPNGNGWDTQCRFDIPANVTVAGQSAPGSGITVMGGQFKAGNTNMIVRNLTVAPGYGNRGFWEPGNPNFKRQFPDQYTYDAFDISGTNLMIDHVSTVNATDETISMNELANNITVQYSNIAQGLNYPQADAEGTKTVYTGHALGSLLQAGSNAKISIHHNLYAHLKGRLPRVGSEVGTGAHNDFRNNVFYNWLGNAGEGASGQPSYSKFVGNFFLAGNGGDNVSQTNGPDGLPNTTDDIGIIVPASGGTGIFDGKSSSATRIYHSGNLKDTNHDGDALDGAALTNSDFSSSAFVTDASFSIPYTGVTDSATAAYDRVLNYAGANWWNRDATINSIDERIINEVRTGTGRINAWADDPFNSDPNEGTEWRAMKDQPAVYRAANWDQEASIGYGQGDGMPTYWELQNGLNPTVRDDTGDFDADGYTNLEEYLNEIAAWPAPAPLIFNGTTNGRYEQTTNWSYQWEPSRFDEAQILNGNVTLDSVGQHARLLKVAPNAGNVAQLTVSGGLRVEEQLSIGAGGQVTQSAGAVTTAVLDVKGTYQLDGGQLNVTDVQLSGAGLLKLASGGDKTLRMTTVSAINTAKLDVRDNQLIVTGMDPIWNGSAYTGVAALVVNGRNGGAWNGSGIITSETAAALASGLTTLAVATAAEVGYAGGTFGGYSVAGSDVLVMYTFGGDANFDGMLDADDYFRIDSNYGKNGKGFANGDFNYDTVINGDDYSILDSNFAATHGAPAPPVAAVPEPGFLAAAGGVLLLCQRRRRGVR